MPSIIDPIRDYLVRRGSEDRTINLSQVFAGEGLSYTVTSSRVGVVSAMVDGDQLVLDYGDQLDYSDLVITATDASGNSVSENLRVRITGENAYTIVAFPDTQDYSRSEGAPIVREMADWMLAHQESLNIVFMTHVGDVTADAQQSEWANINEALSVLNGRIPYALTAGNHDQAMGGTAAEHSSQWMDHYYSPELQAQYNETFGGTYDMAPDRSPNNYHTFTAPDGTKWLSLSVEFGPSDDVLRWAKGVIESHSDHRVMITTHSYMNWAGRHDATGGPYYAEGAGYDYGLGRQPEGSNDGESIWRELIQPYANVSFTFSGHIFGDGAETLVSYDNFGNPVYQMLVNYQNGVASEIQQGNGGNGAMRLLTIDPENGQVYTSTYFAHLDSYLTDLRGEELDRDGLTGPYRDQEEVLELNLGTPQIEALAKAGNDLVVEAGSDGQALVTLGGRIVNGESIPHEVIWTDANGTVLAEGPAAQLTLPAGRHMLTMQVSGRDGARSSDQVVVIVGDAETLLIDTFNDGNADGWSTGEAAPLSPLSHGTTESFGIKGLPGAAEETYEDDQPAPSGPPIAVVALTAASRDQGLLLTPGDGLSENGRQNYTLAFDLYVPGDTAGGYIGLVQGDGTNTDADMFLMNTEGHMGLGTMTSYHGSVPVDSWARIVLSYQVVDGQIVIDKYVNGTLVGTNSREAETRYELNPEGIRLFTDNDGETSPLVVSSIALMERPLTSAEALALGGVSAEGLSLPQGATGTLFQAGPEGFVAIGAASLTLAGGLTATPGTDHTLAAPVPLPAEGSDQPVPPEGVVAGVTKISAMGQGQGLHVDMAALNEGQSETGPATAWSMIFDLQTDATGSGWQALFQTDLSNVSDADFFINSGGAIGISGSYHGRAAAGEWNRIAVTAEPVEGGATLFNKYINGVLVGNTTSSGERFHIDPEKGILLFADEDGETRDIFVSGVAFTDSTLSAEAIADLGGVSSDGVIFTEDPGGRSFELDFSGEAITDRFGKASAGVIETSQSATGSFIVKGSYADRVEGVEIEAAPEGRVWESSNASDKKMVWADPAAQEWDDYRYEVTLQSTDKDTIGALFRYQDDQNHYRVSFNAYANTRELVQVRDGIEAVLASVSAGMPWTRDVSLEIAVKGGEIRVFLDGNSVFGTVTDADPILSGSVGFWSSAQKSSQFDDVFVGGLGLQAKISGQREVLDQDGDGRATVSLDAANSYGADEISSYRWLAEDGSLLGEGAVLQAQLAANGATRITLEITDTAGRVAHDVITVDAVSEDRILFSDDFSEQGFTPRWEIVDEGEFGGVGVDGTLGDWQVIDGVLTQLSDVASRELKWTSANASDPWNKGWSPHGDGTNVLRKGTTALIADDAAKDWENYAVEVTVSTPDNGALGVMVHYQDAGNYYKVELDAQTGASFFQLIEVKNGVEKFLTQIPARYTPDQPFRLRVEVVDNAIQAAIDGNAIFSYPIIGSGSEKGTAGLFTWGSAGAGFDDLRVVQLPSRQGDVTTNHAPVAGNDRFIMHADGTLVLAAALLLENDRDEDGDALQLTSVTALEGGSVSIDNEGNVQFRADPGHQGSAWFEYRITDANGATAFGLVELVQTGYSVTITATASGGAFHAPEGSDTFFLGQEGADRFFGQGGDDQAQTGGGDDYASGSDGDDQIDGEAGDDVLVGGAGDDILYGGSGNDLLSGGMGDDILEAGSGSDTLSGGAGNDTLITGAGENWLGGGAGEDVFVFTAIPSRNVVTDFTSGDDLIDLSAFSSIRDMAELREQMREVDGNTLITLETGIDIELRGVSLASLDADDFRFA